MPGTFACAVFCRVFPSLWSWQGLPIISAILYLVNSPEEGARALIIALSIILVGTVVAIAVFLAPTMMPRKIIYSVEPDTPCSFGYKMSWIAIKTGDVRKVLDVLGLYQIEQTNWRSGIGTVYHKELGENRIFVSPPVRGWIFVVGLAIPHPIGERFMDKWTPLMESLAEEFSDVQYFFSYPSIDFYGWARVLKGRISRAFAIGDEGIIMKRGRTTREEKGLGLKLFELRGVRGLSGDAGGELVLYPTETHVMRLAGQWGIDPTGLARLSKEPGLGYIGQAPAYWRPERLRNAA